MLSVSVSWMWMNMLYLLGKRLLGMGGLWRLHIHVGVRCFAGNLLCHRIRTLSGRGLSETTRGLCGGIRLVCGGKAQKLDGLPRAPKREIRFFPRNFLE